MDGQTDGLEEKAKKRLTKRLTDEHRRERKESTWRCVEWTFSDKET
jgi:hypothetical protein